MRAAEAVKRCKPQEVTALVLKAQGLGYAEIAEHEGWTSTKVSCQVGPPTDTRHERRPDESPSLPVMRRSVMDVADVDGLTRGGQHVRRGT